MISRPQPAASRQRLAAASERDARGTGFVADAEGRSGRHIVEAALEALCRVRHRGAVAADAKTGDGAGVLIPVPGRFLAHELETSQRLPGSVRVAFRGSAGQSFAAFLTAGVEFHLEGEANDYVGKGMGGGLVVILPPPDDAGDPWLVGNVALYGATGGELYVAGRAGERFAVRNSGATAVVEGIGGHGCGYMTGGTVVVLGPVGQNLGAGVTGGQAYVYDPEAGLPARVNPELVELTRPCDDQLAALKRLVVRHGVLTRSPKARTLLATWHIARSRFWRMAPRADVAAISQKSEGTPGRTRAGVPRGLNPARLPTSPSASSRLRSRFRPAGLRCPAVPRDRPTCTGSAPESHRRT